MKILLKYLIRYGSYPLIISSVILIVYKIADGTLAYWPTALAIIVMASLIIAFLERIDPYQEDWLDDHQDTFTDIIHALLNLSLIVLTSEVISLLYQFNFTTQLWPKKLPLLLQLLLVGLIIDFGLWVMHYMSHKYRRLWKLHAIHHQSQRLYWLNAEKRHPLSALLLAAPSLIILTIIGAPSLLIGCWMSMMAVHLAFQHANLDYRLGPFKNIFAVAEVHRWHHKHGYGQKNFGEVFVVWDHLFKTFHYQDQKVQDNQVGIKLKMPNDYLGQLKWPFKK